MGKTTFLLVTFLLATTVRAEENITRYLKFPTGFKLGAATASYQIEGAWNVSDKGVNVWDRFTHENPSPIKDGSNGDVACDSYHKYKEDITILTDLGVNAYRISLSWSRILPTGFADKVSKDGIRYYKNLLDDLNAQGIEPFVSIYHWDHPAVLEDMGGWTNEMMATWFSDYARVVFTELGDRVKMFATINEPAVVCNEGYSSGGKAPGKSIPDVAPYLCMHNMLKAHAKTYKIYDTEFRKTQNGKIGIVLPCPNYYPKYENDTESADIAFNFDCGWTANPIFSKTGDYPDVMKQRIAENSKLQGYPISRLPEFTQAEIDYIRGTADYLGLNHYTSYLTEIAPKSDNTVWYGDSGVIKANIPNTPPTISSWLTIFPQGFGDMLRKLKAHYNNTPVYVVENGMADDGLSLNDTQRIGYLHDYIREMLVAVNRDECNVKGYFVWSFLDNFEWDKGYTEHFGIVNVDFQNPNRPRTPKLSYYWYKELIRTRELPALDAVSRNVL